MDDACSSTSRQHQQQPSLILDDPGILNDPWCIPLELIDSCRTGDVMLICQDNKGVQCHSQLLALCSPVLRDMLDSTRICDGCSDSNPARVYLLDDQAEHWLFALRFVYPNAPLPKTVHMGNAAALALLGHKYAILRVMDAWEGFVSFVIDEDPSIGHYKWCIPYWGVVQESVVSKTFEAGGHKWNLQVYPDGFGEGKDSCVSLFLNRSSTEECPEVDATFQLVMLSHAQLSDAIVTSELRKVFDNRKGWGWARFVGLDVFRDTRKAYVKDDKVEFHVVIRVHRVLNVSARRYRLSGAPDDAGYVFKWLDLAHKVRNDVLEQKCLKFLADHVFYALTNARFRKDMCAALAHVDPDRLLMIMRKAARHL